MLKQIRLLTKLQLCNCFNLNVFRYTKDTKKRNGMIGMSVVMGLVVLMMFMYVGGISYGYIQIGLANVLPMYLVTIASLMIFLFAMFKTGSIIFAKSSYEMLCSMPVSNTAIVISRFFSMYVGNVLLALGIMIPGMFVYGCHLHPGVSFYVIGLLGCIFIPMLPITVATLFGALVTAIASRMKHKSLVGAGLSILLVFGIMLGSSQLVRMEDELTTDLLVNLSEMVTKVIGRVYPPAVWLGKAMLEADVLQLLLYLGCSIAIFCVMVLIVSSQFQSIWRALHSTSAKHNYQMKRLETNSIFMALYKKEFKRYFASSIYVTNTIISPIMMVVFSIIVLVTGFDQIQQYIPVGDRIKDSIPFILAATGCIMTTTCTSISMEGKGWWILSSLPVKASTVFLSKIAMNLTLIAPFYVISEMILIVAVKPNLVDMIWMILIPAILILFSCVYGITINLRFPVFDWENEVSVVKQSVASMVGGLGGLVIVILCMVPVLLLTQISANLLKAVICILVLGITILLYRRNAKVDLQQVGA